MNKLENEKMLFAVSQRGEITNLVNKISGHNYISQPKVFWKLIYRTTSDQEIPIFAHNQSPQIEIAGDKLNVSYQGLVDGAARRNISLSACS